MPIVKRLSSLASIKRKTPADSLPTGFLGDNAVSASMLRDLSVQTRHLDFKLASDSGSFSLPSRIFGVTTSASELNFVRYNTVNSSYVAGIASSLSTSDIVGVLTRNSSGAAVDVVTHGIVSGFSGLTPGSTYYLSQTVSGGITATIPTSGVIVAVGRALTSTTLLVDIDPNLGRSNRLEYREVSWTYSGSPSIGDSRPWIRVPYNHTITNAYAVAKTAGSSQSIIDIQYATQSSVDGTIAWTSLFSTTLRIDANKLSSNSSTTPRVFNSGLTSRSTNDHYRVLFSTVGTGILDVTVYLELTMRTTS